MTKSPLTLLTPKLHCFLKKCRDTLITWRASSTFIETPRLPSPTCFDHVFCYNIFWTSQDFYEWPKQGINFFAAMHLRRVIRVMRLFRELRLMVCSIIQLGHLKETNGKTLVGCAERAWLSWIDRIIQWEYENASVQDASRHEFEHLCIYISCKLVDNWSDSNIDIVFRCI